MDVSPAKRFNRLIQIVRFCARVCGADVSNPDYKMYWLTYCVLGAIFFFYGCTIYTVYVGVIVQGDWTVILQASAMVGSAVQGLAKLLALLPGERPERVRKIQKVYEDLYSEYENKTVAYRTKLQTRIQKTYTLVTAFLYIYFLGTTLLIAIPVFALVVYNEKLLIMQFLVPGIDKETDSGHLMLLSLHIMCLCFGAFGNFCADMYLFVFITNVPLLTDIMKVKFRELNKVAVQPDLYDEMRRMLWDILDLHHKYAKLLHSTEKIYNVIMLVELVTSSISILCTIACIFIGVWIAAPVYLIYSFSVLYTFCGLGTLIEISNEDLTEDIYNACLWYVLPVAEQKLFVMMLAKSQTEMMLTAGHILPLSMNQALQLTKAIVSYSMMLFNYLE